METAIPIALAPLASLQPSETPASQRASASGPRYRLAENIGFTAVIMAELKLSQIEREILLADMVEASHNATLEEAPERFEIVGVNLAAHIFALSVSDGLVREILFQEAIAGMLVGGDQIYLFADRLSDKSVKRDGVSIFYDLADNVALPTDGSNDAYFSALLATTDMGFLSQCRFLSLPPMKVSSISTIPISCLKSGSYIAARKR